MNTDGHGYDPRLLHAEVTEKIIGAVYEVHNELGGGFLERVYENSLAYLLRQAGCEIKQ